MYVLRQRQKKVCLNNFRILLMLNHVCEWLNPQHLKFKRV